MTLDAGRKAIEVYFKDSWTATAYALDGEPCEPVAPFVQLVIKDGSVMQGSIGRAQNTLHNVGILTLVVYTDALLRSSAWRGYAQDLMDLFRGKTLDENGNILTTQAQEALVRFSPPQDNSHPYIGAEFIDGPLHRTNVICPFLRYSLQ